MAVSHAVRIPSRVELDGELDVIGLPSGTISQLPTLIAFPGDDDLQSEKLLSYEIGYRTSPASNLILDIAAFYNEYDDLRTAKLDADVRIQQDQMTLFLQLTNDEEAKTYGFELSADWRPAQWSRVQLGYSFFAADYERKSDDSAADSLPLQQAGDRRDPRHQVILHPSFNVRHNWELDLWFRYVDDIKDVFIPSPPGLRAIDDYWTLDARIGWHFNEHVSFSLVGRNLVDALV